MPRPISIADFPEKAERQAPADCGPAPQMDWIPIAKLVVDESYQREITRQGRANVLRIAAQFRWSYFSCVVVAPLAGGLYAIVSAAHIARELNTYPVLLDALKRAKQFIENGVELGFIRMPDASTPDPAHDALPAILAAIEAAEAPLQPIEVPHG